MQEEMENLVKQPLGPILRKYASTAADLAGRLQKQIQVELYGMEVEVSYDRLGGLFSTLRHLIRNSVDHGVASSGDRIMLGKTEGGKLILKVFEEDQTLKFIIADDGAGIDAQRIKAIGLEKKDNRPGICPIRN